RERCGPAGLRGLPSRSARAPERVFLPGQLLEPVAQLLFERLDLLDAVERLHVARFGLIDLGECLRELLAKRGEIIRREPSGARGGDVWRRRVGEGDGHRAESTLRAHGTRSKGTGSERTRSEMASASGAGAYGTRWKGARGQRAGRKLAARRGN